MGPKFPFRGTHRSSTRGSPRYCVDVGCRSLDSEVLSGFRAWAFSPYTGWDGLTPTIGLGKGVGLALRYDSKVVLGDATRHKVGKTKIGFSDASL